MVVEVLTPPTVFAVPPPPSSVVALTPPTPPPLPPTASSWRLRSSSGAAATANAATAARSINAAGLPPPRLTTKLPIFVRTRQHASSTRHSTFEILFCQKKASRAFPYFCVCCLFSVFFFEMGVESDARTRATAPSRRRYPPTEQTPPLLTASKLHARDPRLWQKREKKGEENRN